MNDKKLEYVKLVFYEDKKNYDKSWGEVHYKLIYGDNQVHRTYKEKITTKEYPLCLRAFRMQEGTDALPFEKYQIYDAKTKKPLNMPYYLKKKSKAEIIGDKIKSGVSKTAKAIDAGLYKIDELKRREPKEVDKSVLYAIRGGISDIKGNGNRKIKEIDSKKMLVRITSIATVTVLLGALGNFELKKHKINFSNIVNVVNMSNKTNYLDNEIRDNYYQFEVVLNKLINQDYEKISDDDIRFFNKYVYMISRASNDSLSEGNFYEFNYLNYLDKNSPDYSFFSLNNIDYNFITINNKYKKDKAYEFCAKGCNLLFYSLSALSTNRSTYMPSKNDLYSFGQMSILSKIVFLNELKGAVVATNFTYQRGDEPYWWIGLRMDNGKILEKIDKMIIDCNETLMQEINIKQNENHKTM